MWKSTGSILDLRYAVFISIAIGFVRHSWKTLTPRGFIALIVSAMRRLLLKSL